MTVTKQFKLVLKEEHKDSKMEPQLMGYPGEPLDKMKDRLKKKYPDINYDFYELNNSDVEVTEDGLILLGKMMKLYEKLRPEIKMKDIKYIVEDGKDLLKPGTPEKDGGSDEPDNTDSEESPE